MFKVSMLFRALFAAAMPMYAFDPKDPADVAILDEAIEKALEPVKAHNKKLLGELKTAKKATEIDPAAHAELETERDTLATQLSDAQKALKAANTATETATKALEGEQGYNRGLLVDNGLLSALTEAGVKNPAHLKAAAAMLKSSAAIEVKVDGATQARSAMVGDKALGAYVKEWSLSDEGKAFVTAPSNGGGGALGGTGGTGGASGTGNLAGTATERAAAILTRFPNLAPKT